MTQRRDGKEVQTRSCLIIQFGTAPYHQASVFDQPPHGTQTNTAAMAAPRTPAAPYVIPVAIAAFVEVEEEGLDDLR